MKKLMLIVTAVLFSTSIILAQDNPVKTDVKKDNKEVKQQVKKEKAEVKQEKQFHIESSDGWNLSKIINLYYNYHTWFISNGLYI